MRERTPQLLFEGGAGVFAEHQDAVLSGGLPPYESVQRNRQPVGQWPPANDIPQALGHLHRVHIKHAVRQVSGRDEYTHRCSCGAVDGCVLVLKRLRPRLTGATPCFDDGGDPLERAPSHDGRSARRSQSSAVAAAAAKARGEGRVREDTYAHDVQDERQLRQHTGETLKVRVLMLRQVVGKEIGRGQDDLRRVLQLVQGRHGWLQRADGGLEGQDKSHGDGRVQRQLCGEGAGAAPTEASMLRLAGEAPQGPRQEAARPDRLRQGCHRAVAVHGPGAAAPQDARRGRGDDGDALAVVVGIVAVGSDEEVERLDEAHEHSQHRWDALDEHDAAAALQRARVRGERGAELLHQPWKLVRCCTSAGAPALLQSLHRLVGIPQQAGQLVRVAQPMRAGGLLKVLLELRFGDAVQRQRPDAKVIRRVAPREAAGHGAVDQGRRRRHLRGPILERHAPRRVARL
mmetsp:Transcript_129150/g.361417  ORF Transcript_129150/g.361417 Transcript_129150/m.361417 type:complete len:459 (+) Transcript_129150:876-2252(+)